MTKYKRETKSKWGEHKYIYSRGKYYVTWFYKSKNVWSVISMADEWMRMFNFTLMQVSALQTEVNKSMR